MQTLDVSRHLITVTSSWSVKPILPHGHSGTWGSQSKGESGHILLPTEAVQRRQPLQLKLAS